MAVLALLGILLSVVGTTWISQQPASNTSLEPIVSGESQVSVDPISVVQK